MKGINSHTLLASLKADSTRIMQQAHALQDLPQETLTASTAPGKWNVAEILEHLNIYSEYYLPVIEKKLRTSRRPSDPVFRSGWLGNYFTNMMKPTPENIIPHKMKTFKNAIPPQQTDAGEALARFMRHGDTLMKLLERSGQANLNTIRIPISISRLITFRLGDTFRFFIAHQERHFLQIKNTLHAVEEMAEQRRG